MVAVFGIERLISHQRHENGLQIAIERSPLLPLGFALVIAFNLETSVGRARWCVGSRACREATTPQAGACKEARQRQVREPACQRMGSGLT